MNHQNQLNRDADQQPTLKLDLVLNWRPKLSRSKSIKEQLHHSELCLDIAKRLEDHEDMLQCQISRILVVTTTTVYSQTEDIPALLKKAFNKTAYYFLQQQFNFVSLLIFTLLRLLIQLPYTLARLDYDYSWGHRVTISCRSLRLGLDHNFYSWTSSPTTYVGNLCGFLSTVAKLIERYHPII